MRSGAVQLASYRALAGSTFTDDEGDPEIRRYSLHLSPQTPYGEAFAQ
jgi:hypothetical protein